MTSTQRYRLDVELLEDLHSGTGTTSGELDAVQCRGRDGRPVVRDSHLTGLLREAAFELAELGVVTTADVYRMFGREGGARRRLACGSLRCTTDVSTRIWYSASRRPHDRGPETNLLRSREHVPAGTRFVAEMELRGSTHADLLANSVRRLTHLGARRRRDVGPIVADLQEIQPTPTTQIRGTPNAERPRLRIVLRLLEPACFGTAAVPENFIPTECYIRGQAVGGAFANWALDHDVAAADLLAGSAGVTFRPGLPLPQTRPTGKLADLEVMPIPLDVRSSKPPPQRRADCPHWAEAAYGYVGGEPSGSTPDDVGARSAKPKRPGAREFLFRAGPKADWLRFTPPVGRHMRNNAGEARRKRLPSSALYAREEIMEETDFLIEFDFTSDVEATAFVDRFRDVLIGLSWLKVGRGGTPAQVVDAEFMTTSPPDLDPGATEFRLTLLSDLIARGSHLGFLDTIDGPRLSMLAGCGSGGGGEIDVDQHVDRVVVHGFNAASGLPRSSVPCIRRGSVVICRGSNESGLRNLHDRLAPLPHLGERGAEGFGAFRLDAQPPKIAAAQNPAVAPDPLSSELEATLEEARRLAEQLLRAANDRPSRSQWHNQLDALRTVGSHAELVAWMDALERHARMQAGVVWESRLGLLRGLADAADDEGFPRALKVLRLAFGYVLRDARVSGTGDA